MSIKRNLLKALAAGFAALAAIANSAGPPGNHRNDDPPPLRLALLPNYKSPGLPHAEVLVSTLALPTTNPAAQALAARLGSPAKAKLLIPRRLADEVRATLEDTDPEELLQRYVVLEYPTSQAAMAAKSRLERDPSVLYVNESRFMNFAVAPSDPLYAVVSGVTNYQWGINNPLNLQAAWNQVRGTAFLGHLDNGIQSIQLHEDLGQSAFRRFRFNARTGGNDVDEDPELVNGAAGHGTHVAGIMAAATSQATVPTGYPNPANFGVAGVCWYCNLMIAKISYAQNGFVRIDEIDVATAVNWAVSSGAQALNLSIGGLDPNCTANPNNELCLAIQQAVAWQVVIAAAAGNSNIKVGGDGNAIGTNVDFPASHSGSVAVGAIQATSGVRGNLWTEEPGLNGFRGSSGGPTMTTRGILAPGRDVLSTFYDNRNWNTNIRCQTTGTTTGPRYGICTGTSMATPHITGLVGLMRSINPLLNATTIRTMLLNSGDNAGFPSTTRGFGVPNALTAVNSVLATSNRLTPLFGFYSTVLWNHFYTVVPQQARAATGGTLIPSDSTPYGTPYGTDGNTVYEYAGFPAPSTHPAARNPIPRADAWVFSTFQNPFNASVELKPLYRLSWACGDTGRTTAACGTNPSHVTHVYSTDLTETQGYMGQGYALDGIEGYVLPTSLPKPVGTTELRRAYSSARDEYVLYPTEQEFRFSATYTQGQTILGYVYLNNGPRPTY